MRHRAPTPATTRPAVTAKRAERPVPAPALTEPRGPSAHGAVGTVAEVAPAVEEVLSAYLAERAAESGTVGARFTGDVVGHLTRFLLGGGKRLRPAFLWCGWRAGGGTGATDGDVLRIGAALELLQGCALIHDDLMDGSSVRRGSPSTPAAFTALHRSRALSGDPARFGASAALLAGDLALVWAQDLWEETALSATARRRGRGLWRTMRTEMVAGQYLDLYGQAAGSWSPPETLRVAHLKAGLYTVQRPLGLGAAIAGAGRRTREALERAGQAVGVVFQLLDDLSDLYGQPSSAGRPAGEDVRRGTPTYLMAVAMERARAGGHRNAERVLTEALGDASLDEAGLERVRAAVARVGARGVVERHIEELTGQARNAIAEAGLDDVVERELNQVIEDVLRAPLTAPDRPGAAGRSGEHAGSRAGRGARRGDAA